MKSRAGPQAERYPATSIEHVDRAGHTLPARPPRPFGEPNAKLEDELFEHYALPAMQWLLGPHPADIPAIRAGSNWEAALTLTAAIECLQRTDHQHLAYSAVPGLRTHIHHLARWLAERAECHPDGSMCWDHSAWDTSVICRALAGLSITGANSDLLPSDSSILSAVGAALRWLTCRYQEYYAEPVKATLNPAELAQIGRTIAQLSRSSPTLVRTSIEDAGWSRSIDELLCSIAEILIRRRSLRRISTMREGHTIQSEAAWWDDWFGTSDVLMFFYYLLMLAAEDKCVLTEDLQITVRECVVGCFALIEDTQSDGLWGAYLDTIAILGTYVQVGSTKPATYLAAAAQPRIVFRTLRWICDPTQSFSDGSVLHTGFLTNFYAITLLQIIRYWPEAQLTILELYDELSLITDRGITVDRANYLSAALERDRLAIQLDREKRRQHSLRTRLDHEKWVRSRVVLSTFIFSLSIILVVTLPLIFSVVRVHANVSDASSLFGITTTVIALAVGTGTIVWTASRPPEDDDFDDHQQ